MDFFERQIEKTAVHYKAAKEFVDNTQGVQDSSEEKKNSITPEIFWGEVLPYKRQRRGGKLKILGIVVLLLLSCTVMALMMTSAVLGKGWLRNMFEKSGNMSFTLPLYDTPQLEEQYYQPDGRYTAEGVAKAIGPSVVSIVVYSGGNTVGELTNGSSQGSGVIISADGYIVTNAHVVDTKTDNTKITVILHDDTMYQAQLIGSDVKTDIAVIKIAASGLSPAQFCDSDKVSVGEEVVAIGSPAGLYGSVTKGIVSAVDREIQVSEEMREVNCIQIDAAINHGNSGGALLNMWGQVIGITSSKLNSAIYDSIGFAISTNEAKPIIESLIENGYVADRVRVGIIFNGISPLHVQMYGYATAGLRVVEIDKDCDIANTELAVGDFITHFDGKAVYDVPTIDEVLDSKKPGDTMKATVAKVNEDGSEIISTYEIVFKLEADNTATDGMVKD